MTQFRFWDIGEAKDKLDAAGVSYQEVPAPGAPPFFPRRAYVVDVSDAEVVSRPTSELPGAAYVFKAGGFTFAADSYCMILRAQ